MNEQVTVGLTVAVVIMAAAGAVLMMDDGGSDYYVLDSLDNLAPGQVFRVDGETDTSVSVRTLTLTGVSGSNIDYDYDTGMDTKGSVPDPYNLELEDFQPYNDAVGFDYTDPDEVAASGTDVQTAVVDADTTVYTINGVFSTYEQKTFTDLRITVSGGDVTDVSGGLASSGEGYTQSRDCVTEGGVLRTSVSERAWGSASGDFTTTLMMMGVIPWSALSGQIVTTETAGVLAGNPVTIYACDGDQGAAGVFDDMKFYVYGDYVVKMDGKWNGNYMYSMLTVKA